MCYRVSTPGKESVQQLLKEGFTVEDWNPYFHTAGHTHMMLPTITQDAPKTVKEMQWGVKPWWPLSPQDKVVFENRTLNTMAEYWNPKKPPHEFIHEQRRAIVLVDGFYEFRWEDEKGKVKTPYYIYMEGHKPFGLASLEWLWVNKETGETYHSTSILTTKANQLLAHIHNKKERMPVVLNMEDFDTWLAEDISKEDYKRITASYPEGILQSHVLLHSPAKRNAPVDCVDIQQAMPDNYSGLF